jgi:hypothetical protein
MSDFAPDYATLRSVVAAAVRCGRIASIEEAFAPSGGNVDIDRYLGESSAALGAHLFDDVVDADHLLLNHSHFSVFGNLLSAQTESSFERALIDSTGDADALRAHLLSFGGFEATVLRRCPQCVEEDVAQFGNGHWRIFHQFPVARHCVVHGCRLQTRCAHCKAPILRSDRPLLADDPCERCGHDRFSATSFKPAVAYWPTLRAMYQLLSSVVLKAKPEARRAKWEQAREHWTSRCQIRDPILRALEAWACSSLDSLATSLQCTTAGGNEAFDITSNDSLAPSVLIAVMTAVQEFG